MSRKNEVTDIKVGLKHHDRRSIYINGEYAFTLPEGIFFQEGIKIGDRLTDAQIDALVSASEGHKIRDAAFLLLSYRPRSVRELSERLQQKGWSRQEIEPVLRDLEDEGYLDDLEFARVLARDRTQRKFLGPAALRHDLLKSGIDNEIIKQVLDETYAKTPPASLIASILKKRGLDPAKPINAKEKTRLINLLKRKGFGWSDIEPVVSVLKTR